MSSKITQDDRFQPVNTGRVDVFCVPMAAAKSTIVYLKQIMPGQPEAWYERIANEITSGRMPLPRVDDMPDPDKLEPLPRSPKPEAKPIAINPARQRFLDSLTQSESPNQSHFPSTGQWQPEPSKPVATPKPAAKPKSKTQQLNQGTYRAKLAVSNSASEATKQKLYSLTKDWDTAFRLVEKLQYIYPDQSAQWCWGKAINIARSETQVPQPTIKPQSESPADVVSEATKAKLLELCKTPERAEYLVAAERRTAYSEENAWQRAYDKLMDERMNLYTKIGYYS